MRCSPSRAWARRCGHRGKRGAGPQLRNPDGAHHGYRVDDHGGAVRGGGYGGGDRLRIVRRRQRGLVLDRHPGGGGAGRGRPALRRHGGCGADRGDYGAERGRALPRVQSRHRLRHFGAGDDRATAGAFLKDRSARGRRLMSSGQVYYLTTLLVYAGVDAMACIALNLQFGISGLVNFGFIVFQAAGAYTAAVLSMPPANGGFQQYILGLRLPFPLPWLGGAAVGGLLAVPVGLVVLRRLRSDYQAIALLVLSVIANTVITNARPFLNGAAGLSLVPPPLVGVVNTETVWYQWLYVGLTALGCAIVYVAAGRIINSPYGRTLRAMRERELAAAALGKNLVTLKMTMFVVGGVFAGLSGAI